MTAQCPAKVVLTAQVVRQDKTTRALTRAPAINRLRLATITNTSIHGV